MDIHKPKPVHGWREFLNEIGVIVCGILIALALEQGVEQLHWAHEVEKAHAALRSEIGRADLVFAYRVAAQPCIARRVDALEAVIERQAKGEAVPRLGAVIPDIGNALNDNVWQDHRAAQTLTHFDDDELHEYGLYYLQLGNVREFIGREVEPWDVLKVLQGDPARLSPVDLAGLRVAVQNARFYNKIIATIAADELAYSKALGVAFPGLDAPTQDRLKEVCSPLGLQNNL